MSYAKSLGARRRWAQPGAREEQAERMIEAARSRHVETFPVGRQYGKQRGASVYFDTDTFDAIVKQARAQKKSFAEVVRTYVEWGLELEAGEQAPKLRRGA